MTGNRNKDATKGFKMRFTTDVVHAVATAAGEVTDGAFQFGYVRGPLSDGMVYADGIDQLVWRGKDSGKQAAAYYAHGAHSYAQRAQATSEPALPEIITTVMDELADADHAVTEAAQRGTSDGEDYWRRAEQRRTTR